MSVFISYDRRDEHIAHFLSYILKSKGLSVLIDRSIGPGDYVDKKVQSYINQADVVLVLLTQHSAQSAWVNQEIGFAAAKGKRIWPICLEKKLRPEGMISNLNKYSLLDWNNPDQTIGNLISELRQGDAHSELDLAINGKLARTKFLVEQLADLQRSGKTKLRIYHQSAFSIFATSHDPQYRESGIHNEEYVSALMEERDLLDKLARRPDTDFRMILWPVKAYSQERLDRRYRTLLEWLKDVKTNHPNIKVIVGRNSKLNELVICGEFVLEGYKAVVDRPGYDVSVYRVTPATVESAARIFESRWEELQKNGDEPIAAITRLLNAINRPGVSLDK